MSSLFEFSLRICTPKIVCVCVLIYQEFQVKFCSDYPGYCGIDAGHSRSRSAHCEEVRLWGKVRNGNQSNQKVHRGQTVESAPGKN